MTAAAAVLEQLHRQGLRVRAAGNRVLLGPRAKITPAVLELVRQHKPAILEALATGDSVPIATQGNPDLERRRARVERELAEHREQRHASDVVDAPLRPEPGSPVSVVLAVRTAAGIVSGELHIPRERFDPALFFKTLEESSTRPS
jgi:hypothetical protein